MADIITLGGKFSAVSDLQKYCDAQFIALKSAMDQIKKLENEVNHLQQLLASTTELIQSPKVDKIIKSPELAICEAQIEILQNRALQKELTLEEVKTLDLLIKNKRLLNGDATTIEGSKKKQPKQDVSEAELIQLAKIEDK